MARVAEPPLSDDITTGGLDPEVRRDLRGLQKDTANSVARHLVAAGMLLDEDPELALEHARFARTRASRIAVVREAAGIAAYHAGEWAEALGELRAARRMGGGPGHLAVMADIERALGRPERALDLSRGPEVRELDRAETIELLIVAAGARRDMGEFDAAVVTLQVPELDPARRDPWSARLFYAHADNLLAAGRESDALEWFVRAANADADGETDADLRIAELTGEPLDAEDVEFGPEEFDETGIASDRETEPEDRRAEEPAGGAAEVVGDGGVSEVELGEESDSDLRGGERADGPAEVVGDGGVSEVELGEESDSDLGGGERADGPAGVVGDEEPASLRADARGDEGVAGSDEEPASVRADDRGGEPADRTDAAAEGDSRGADGAPVAGESGTSPTGSAGEDAPGEDAVGEAVRDETAEVPAEGTDVAGAARGEGRL